MRVWPRSLRLVFYPSCDLQPRSLVQFNHYRFLSRFADSTFREYAEGHVRDVHLRKCRFVIRAKAQQGSVTYRVETATPLKTWFRIRDSPHVRGLK
jgi:hypothetical protein